MKTFSNSTNNRPRLYKIFYQPNGRLPYSVKVTYQTVLPNGTRYNITTKGPSKKCITFHWVWLSSPLFILVGPVPHSFNFLTFSILNYFRPSPTPTVIIQVPQPCTNDTQYFLTLMTSLVSLCNNRLLHVAALQCALNKTSYCSAIKYMHRSLFGQFFTSSPYTSPY